MLTTKGPVLKCSRLRRTYTPTTPTTARTCVPAACSLYDGCLCVALLYLLIAHVLRVCVCMCIQMCVYMCMCVYTSVDTHRSKDVTRPQHVRSAVPQQLRRYTRGRQYGIRRPHFSLRFIQPRDSVSFNP